MPHPMTHFEGFQELPRPSAFTLYRFYTAPFVREAIDANTKCGKSAALAPLVAWP